MHPLRRASLGLGAITSTGVLHALWSTPIQPISRGAFDDINLHTLDSLSEALVSHDENGTTSRIYHPIGEIVALYTLDKSIRQGVKRAIRIPPIFKRLCIWVNHESCKNVDKQTLLYAQRARTGVISLCNTHVEELIRPHNRIPGIPAVFRWWVAELAYETVMSRTTSPMH